MIPFARALWAGLRAAILEVLAVQREWRRYGPLARALTTHHPPSAAPPEET